MAEQTGPTRFHALFESAMQAYQKMTGITLAEHPLAVQLQSCNSLDSITAILQGQAQAFSNFRESHGIMKSIKTTVSILTSLGAAVSFADTFEMVRQRVPLACFTSLTGFLQPFPPAKAIYSGLAILLDVCTYL
jgi:hypothetical protein